MIGMSVLSGIFGCGFGRGEPMPGQLSMDLYALPGPGFRTRDDAAGGGYFETAFQQAQAAFVYHRSFWPG